MATQVNEIDSDMQDIIRRQDIPIDEKAKLYDQNLQRYLTFYDKRMNKPLRVNVTHTDQAEEPQGEQSIVETDPSNEIETDIYHEQCTSYYEVKSSTTHQKPQVK